MSTVTLTKKPARVVLPSCPDWCVRDHADDPDDMAIYGSKFESPADNFGFTARVMRTQHKRPQEAGHGRVVVHVNAGAGLLSLAPEQARELAKVLVALGRDGEAEVVQGAARLGERAARELRGSGR